MTDETELTMQYGRELLLKDRTILEREVMLFRPFGLDEQGQTIRDLSGMSIRAVVVYLEQSMARTRGMPAGAQAVEDLCFLLNQRIKDPVYHVTPRFLMNPWNSYSYEFTAYLYEFCERMSGDPRFLFRGGIEKASSIMQVLARPFSLAQIYSMFPYFGNKFASGSIEFRVIEVTPTSATLAMKFSDRTLRQFGPYRRRCAHLMCQAAQGIMAAVPVRVHGLSPATLTERSCIANDDEWCQWDIHWQVEGQGTWRQRLWRMVAGPGEGRSSEIRPAVFPLHEPAEDTLAQESAGDRGMEVLPILAASGVTQSQRHVTWSFCGALAGMTLAVGLRVVNPSASVGEIILLGLVPMLVAGMLINRHLRLESQQREALIQEQITFVESRHEELREAYLGQEQTRVELRRKVAQLTALHQAGLLFSSTMDREALMQKVLETLTTDLQYDRAMVSYYDPVRRVVKDARLLGASPEIQAFARAREIPVTDPMSPEGLVLLQGQPLLIGDLQAVWDRIHPLNQMMTYFASNGLRDASSWNGLSEQWECLMNLNNFNKEGATMKVSILAILLVLALSGLGSCSALVGLGTALAYEFSDFDRQAAGLPSQTPQEQMSRQLERDQAQAQRHQQQQERAHNSIKQFDPQEFNPPNPYNLYQPGGKTSVCRRGFNGAIHCY